MTQLVPSFRWWTHKYAHLERNPIVEAFMGYRGKCSVLSGELLLQILSAKLQSPRNSSTQWICLHLPSLLSSPNSTRLIDFLLSTCCRIFMALNLLLSTTICTCLHCNQPEDGALLYVLLTSVSHL